MNQSSATNSNDWHVKIKEDWAPRRLVLTIGLQPFFIDVKDDSRSSLEYCCASLTNAIKNLISTNAALSRSQAAPAVGVPDSCLWTQDTDYETDTHYSACGEAWSFIEGGPKENKVRFCQGCGKPVVIASAQPQQKEG